MSQDDDSHAALTNKGQKVSQLNQENNNILSSIKKQFAIALPRYDTIQDQ